MKKEDRRMIEYRTARDSANHYNTLIWTLVSLGIASSLIILYKFWANRPESNLGSMMLFIGAFILYYFSFIIESTNARKVLNYKICEKIEKEYDFIIKNKLKKLPLEKFNYFEGPGINVLRIMKIVLFFIYILSIVTNLAFSYVEGNLSTFKIFLAFTFVLLIIFAIGFELYYTTRKYNWDRILK